MATLAEFVATTAKARPLWLVMCPCITGINEQFFLPSSICYFQATKGCSISTLLRMTFSQTGISARCVARVVKIVEIWENMSRIFTSLAHSITTANIALRIFQPETAWIFTFPKIVRQNKHPILFWLIDAYRSRQAALWLHCQRWPWITQLFSMWKDFQWSE